MDNKQSILLLHGWMQNGHTWDGIVAQLKDEYQCYAPDLPGFGTEPRPKDAWTPAQYAAWVGEYIKKHNIKNPTVVGHSFGGRITIVLASDPSRFARSANAPTTFRDSRFILYATPGFRQPLSKITTMTQALSRALKRAGINTHALPGAASIKSRLESKDSVDAQTLRDIFTATIEYNLRPAMQKIDLPTLLLWGENDTEVPLTIAKAMHQTIKHSELKVMPHTTHFAHLENPALFAGIIREFVRSH